MSTRGRQVAVWCILGLLVVVVMSGCEKKAPAPEQQKAPVEKDEPAAEETSAQPPKGESETPPVSKEDANLIKDIVAKDDWKEATPAAQPVPAKPAKPGRPDVAPVRACAAAPKIDGKLDDACWKAAGIAGAWIDVYTGLPAKPQPKAFVCYDEKNLYVAFLNPESKMKDLVADTEDRDGSTWTDDSNELFIDPSAGRKDYFQLIVNTKGVLYDGQGRGGDWDGTGTVKVHKGEKMWSVEFSIPLSELGVKGSPKGQTWTANFCRNRQVTGEAEALAWSDTGESFHNPEAFGKLKME